jgi:hypothetical protein
MGPKGAHWHYIPFLLSYDKSNNLEKKEMGTLHPLGRRDENIN